jgi:hypothetical protein
MRKISRDGCYGPNLIDQLKVIYFKIIERNLMEQFISRTEKITNGSIILKKEVGPITLTFYNLAVAA